MITIAVIEPGNMTQIVVITTNLYLVVASFAGCFRACVISYRRWFVFCVFLDIKTAVHTFAIGVL
ncbi:hypothetical protein BDB00DRAFT_796690 [Zychaea mexicana]|uniref:uncharacterized protein n=1 Tax=Zychaea mexicana TaxID=64656 RepID=UPI0022FDBC32|nr:uncharacterized protein BDB00DRAFT_796690 [Zychaea mexicana]KAI9499404.1 hypothetical protein BDB00DRAFT_796690 [Zychaea mexicana]